MSQQSQIQNFASLFYPSADSHNALSQHFNPLNSPSSEEQLNEESEFIEIQELRSNSIRVTPNDNPFQLVFENKQNMEKSREKGDLLFQRRSSSPDPLPHCRDRSLNECSVIPKKSVLILKKEFINRQNSRSPSGSTVPHDHFQSPQQSNQREENKEPINIVNSNSQQSRKHIRNVQIIRKTIGPKTKAIEPFFDSNIRGSHIHNQVKSFINHIPMRNSEFLDKSLQPRSRDQNQHTFEIRTPQQEEKFQFSERPFMRQQTANANMKSGISLDSSDDCDFERQSSQNGGTLSVNAGSRKDQQKKFVISKDKVNFIHSKENGKHEIKKIRKLELNTGESQFKTIFDIPFNISQGSKSPNYEAFKRQTSDNLLNWKSSLNHDRSQNYLSLHISNKIDMPKVIKAVPNASFQHQGMFSPKSSQNIQDLTEPNSQLKTKEETNDDKVPQRASNLFQMRRSHSYSKYCQKSPDLNKFSYSPLENKINSDQTIFFNESKINLQIQKLQQIQSHKIKVQISQEEDEQKEELNLGEKPRISQSLLLDNFFSKKKETTPQRNHKPIMMQTQPFQSKSSENINFHKKNYDKYIDNNGPLELHHLALPGRKSTLNNNLNRLIEDQRGSSPVRVSDYLIDMDQIKAKASEKIINNQSPLTAASLGSSNIDDITHQMSASTSSSKPIISLYSATTSEKFKEIIDNMFIPTVTAFKKKGKEKEFRRPTQNPIRRSRSSNKDNLQKRSMDSAKPRNYMGGEERRLGSDRDF